MRRMILAGMVLIGLGCSGGGSKDSTPTAPTSVLTTVVVSLSTSSIPVGQTATASASGLDQNGAAISVGSVSWSSGTPSVATVNASGVVSGGAVGQAQIIATSGSKQGQQSITVVPIAVASVSRIDIAPSSVTMDVGQTATVTATVRDASGNSITGKIVSWLTSDGSIVGGTISGNTATLQAVAAGSANVTASVDGITGTLPVTVRTTASKPVASVTISPASATIVVGATSSMVATLRDAQGNVLTGRVTAWSTSNAAVASGTISGNVATILGVSAGVAAITATSEGIVGSATVTVISSGGGGAISLTCSGVAGGVVYAQDGTYLGRLTNAFDSQSILNTFGLYGSQFSSTSMYNSFSSYGSQFATYSAYNSFTTTPPILYVGNVAAAYVTKNTFKTPRVDPDALRSCTFP